MADDFDFQINDLKFRAAISDELPYQRATAPFRKEQFDSSPTVGDQSLTGWWTRGQMSFHKGEGVKYYEIIDGSEVEHRYRTSEHANPQTPGSVTLGREPTSPWAVAGDRVLDAASNPTSGEIAWVEEAGGARTVKKALASGSGLTGVTMAAGAPNGTLAWGSGYWFAGTDGTNTIQRWSLDAAAATSHTLGGSPLAGLWFGKERLWAVDEGGYVYALPAEPSPLPQAVATADAIFQVPGATLYGPAGTWSFAEGSSAVFLGFLNKVYAVTILSDGGVPTLTAGVVVLTLAANEHIVAMRSALGAVVLCTNMGIRVAAEVNGGLIVGPLMVRGTGACRRLGGYGSNVYALIDDVEDREPGTRLVRVNMEIPVGDLTYAYDSTAVPYDTSTTRGVGTWTEGVVLYGASTTAKMEVWDSPPSPLAPTGELTTGLHRLGTLEGKHFSGVKVRIGGTGGTVTTYAVQADGTETLLATLDAAVDAGAEVSIASEPIEAIGLRFVLARDPLDSDSGPVLLGYQIKALPVPTRQRILRWPLVIQDRVELRRFGTTGRAGKAYADIKALEALESSSAVVTFTDHRTGETGSAYLDSVEFISNTPATGNSNGFGGVAMATLRVLS